ncbi:MAG TPA: response regulator [Opitutaceae bacterium]|jgi:PAS domain S-box-containing protein|nr:response regulator [Opitutaceae bacterium]
MPTALRVLLVEDNPADAEMVVRELTRAGFDPSWVRVDSETEFTAALGPETDIVLSDYAMPQFSGLRALNIFNERGYAIPFILVSGTIGEDLAVTVMKMGAYDYVLKEKMARLGPSVTNALAEFRVKRERRKSQEGLTLFRSLIDQSSDTLEIIDPLTGKYLDVNGKGPAELGCTRTEYLALHVFEVDTSVRKTDWPLLVSKLREVGFVSGEGRHRRKDGSTFPTEFNAKLVKLDKEYVVTVSRDVTMRKRSDEALRASEERFRELAETIHEVFWMMDAKQRTMLYVSPGYERIWGRKIDGLYADPASWLDAVHKDDRERVGRSALMIDSSGSYEEEFRIIRPDGTERWIRDRAFPVKDPQGHVMRIVGVAEDITKSRELQEHFLRAQRMEAIGTLAGGIAHDLNNILSPVLMAPLLLKDSVQSEHDLQLLDLIEQGARRGSNILKQLLTFSRGTGGERISVQLRHLLKEMVSLIRETFPRNIVAKIHVESDLKPVTGDPTQLHQVIMNLCVNARDAMPEGGQLSLTARNEVLGAEEVAEHSPAKPGEFVVVSVKDSGSGIAPEIMGRVFEPFFTTKPPSKGTGLGLSTVLGIVRSHGGFVTVASPPGAGTTFRIFLPASPAETPAGPTADADALPRGHGELILVVDDEESILISMRSLLERHGYSVLTESEGSEAFATYTENRGVVRVVLTDVMMPGMGGVNLVRALKAFEPKLKIIASSGLTDQLTHDNLKAAGVDAIVDKPCAPQAILEALKRVLLQGH